jgi:hypothetical protein
MDVPNSSDWTELLIDAGARVCPSCGKTASVAASLPDCEGDAPRSVPVSAQVEAAGWVCLECGHQGADPIG